MRRLFVCLLFAGLHSAQGLQGNATEEEGPLVLPTFTYEATDADLKEAAYRYGLQVRGEDENQLKLPTMDIEALLLKDHKSNPDRYRWGQYYYHQKRYELTRQYEKLLIAARSEHSRRMVNTCFNRCNGYINETFERPDLSSAGGNNGSILLQQIEMAEFPAKYLTMSLEEMRRITHENCEQWEAHYQCIFGCTADADLVDRLKAGLAGDFHLTANVECPNPSFAKFLPCVGEKAEEWMGQCESRLSGYQQVKSQVNAKILTLEAQTRQFQANLTASRMIYRTSHSSYLIPYVMQIQTEQSKLCAAYGDLLMCALARLKSTCSERATSFVHTSLAENFAAKVLLSKDLVKQYLGGLSSVCMQLNNKATFRVFPIKK